MVEPTLGIHLGLMPWLEQKQFLDFARETLLAEAWFKYFVENNLLAILEIGNIPRIVFGIYTYKA